MNLSLFLVDSSAVLLGYVGPGLGGGAIALVVGVLGSVFLFLLGIVYYPIKRLLRARRGGDAPPSTVPERQAST